MNGTAEIGKIPTIWYDKTTVWLAGSGFGAKIFCGYLYFFDLIVVNGTMEVDAAKNQIANLNSVVQD